VLERFEEYCTVTQSVRQGIPVAVEVFDSEGARLGDGPPVPPNGTGGPSPVL
jgi:hypothetical protein